MSRTPFDDQDLRRLLAIEADDVSSGATFAQRVDVPSGARRRSRPTRVLPALVAALLVVAIATFQLVREAGPTKATGSLYTFDGGQLAPALVPESQRGYAPNFSGPLLSVRGTYALARDAAHKVTVINFWGAWCGPCQTETPQFQTAYERFRDKGVTFVGIDVKDASRGLPRAFVAKYGITYPIVYDSHDRVAAELGGIPMQAVPVTVVLDDQHRVAAVYLQRVAPSDLADVLTALTMKS